MIYGGEGAYAGPYDGSMAGGAPPGMRGDMGMQGQCDECNAGGGGHHGHKGQYGGYLRGCFGPMPQTCYNPSYGCYASTRHMHRYPAFHGTYYRKAYTYRNYFDYPWHAGLHEPTSHFSYHVSGETPAETVPTPSAEGSARMTPAPVRQAMPAPVRAAMPAPVRAAMPAAVHAAPSPARVAAVSPVRSALNVVDAGEPIPAKPLRLRR
jgi:hypothetical protein